MAEVLAAVRALQADNQQLRREVATLRGQRNDHPVVATDTGSGSEGRFGRRALLGKLGVAAVGGIGITAAMAAPAAAASGGDVVLGATNDGGSSVTTITASARNASTLVGINTIDGAEAT